MTVTAADVHNVVFNRPPIGRRGYDAAHVDAFLDEIEREMVRLIEENNDLRTKFERGGLDTAPGDPAAEERMAAQLQELKTQLDQAQRDKAAAEDEARARQAELEQMRAQDAGLADGEGGKRAVQVLTAAQRTADDHVDDARREAEKVLSKARSTAEEVTRQAKATADELQQDAQRRHDETVAGLDAKRLALQKQIEELKEFERGYRTRLAAYLESQLRDLGHRGRSREAETSPADNS